MKNPLLNLEPGNYVVSGRVIKIVPITDGRPSIARKMRAQAKREGKLLNTGQGKASQSILIMNSGHVILTGKSPEPLTQSLAPDSANR
ncbi:MAG: DUF370 domain-containing protein [Deltaproteobacteria bacterium]|nr:DUF370 domain-containing protein [Deltaproteobacteria bacterium]